jgi:bifunctional non-homologous end joining protein LigD
MATAVRAIDFPKDAGELTLKILGKTVELTNLKKIFWPKLGLTKRDLLAYYAAISPALLPHLKDRAMVMKRYPNGAAGKFFFMKRAPESRPAWIETCRILHPSGTLIDFPMVQDLASLLWVVNLGCIDMNQWYATCEDPDRPDYMSFDLDPVAPADFGDVKKAALAVRDHLNELKMHAYPKTSGSRGIHIYVPIKRGPKQKEVWTIAKEISIAAAAKHPDILTTEYRKVNRPPKHVLIDYNQNQWGRTLASVYSVRPTEDATVSAPMTWEEIEGRADIHAFTLLNMPERVAKLGDLFAPLLRKTGRAGLI